MPSKKTAPAPIPQPRVASSLGKPPVPRPAPPPPKPQAAPPAAQGAPTPPPRTPRPTPAAPAPAAAAAAPAPAAAPVAMGKKIRRGPPMPRALKFARLADKNVRRMKKLVSNWNGEATNDQQRLNAGILSILARMAPDAEKLLEGTALLQNTGFAPTEGKTKRKHKPAAQLLAGTRVAIVERCYDAELHGAPNDFEVVVQVGNRVRIRPSGNELGAQAFVARTQLRRLAVDEGEDAAGGEEEEEIEGGEDEGDGEGEGDEEELEEGEGDEPLEDEDPPPDDGDTGDELDFDPEK